MTPPLQVSVIVVALDGGANLERCLEALAHQEACPSMEVLVAINSDVHVRQHEQRYPQVQFVVPQTRSTFAELRGAAVKRSRGRIVAITEDQCIPPARWCAPVVARRVSRGWVDPPTPLDGAVNDEVQE